MAGIDMNRREQKQASLKIAMLGHKHMPSREGGIEIVVEELSTRMAALGHDVTCYNRRGHHVAGREFELQSCGGSYKGVTLKSVFTVNAKGLAAVTAAFFAAVAAAFESYDIVHFHAEGPCAVIWIPKVMGKRCIATIHGLDWKREKWKHGFGSRYIKFGEKMAARYADEIIVLSREVQKYFWSEYGRKTVYIPNGVLQPRFYPPEQIKDKYGLKKNDYFLFVGRIVPEKGLRHLVDAFKNVDTDKKLVIAGGISDTKPFYEELVRLAADDGRIYFAGFVQGRMLAEFYSNAYVYILPSDLEGMPLSLLEAMSYGNCCLVSDIAECAEVVRDMAVTFHKGDEKDLADKLQYLCDSPDITGAYKSKAAGYICKRYNWTDIVSKTLALYKISE